MNKNNLNDYLPTMQKSDFIASDTMREVNWEKLNKPKNVKNSCQIKMYSFGLTNDEDDAM